MKLAPLLFLLAAATILTACTSTYIGEPEPAFTTVPTTDTSQPANNAAPKVPKQLDASRFIDAPCDALTGTELTGLDPSFANVTGTNASGPLGAACGWANPDLSQSIDITFVTSAANGLDTIYAERGRMAYWQPLVINGYPAVNAATYDGRPQGACVVSTGINDHLYFFADFMTFDPDQQPQSCTFAAKAAGDVIDNLRGGS